VVPQTFDELKEVSKSVFGDDADAFVEYCRNECCVSTKEDIAKLYLGDTFNPRTIAARAFAMEQKKQGGTGYCYVFNHDIPGEDDPGAYHGSDLWFVFNTIDKCWRPFTGKHYDLARMATKYWANFIKTGNPNGLDHDGKPLPEWKPVTEDFVMEFKDVPEKESAKLDKAAQYRIDYQMKKYR